MWNSGKSRAYMLAFVGTATVVCAVAQTSAERGSLSGAIMGVAGDPVPNAQVSITNWRTGSGREVSADSSGRYRADSLDPGVYEVKAHLAGFGTATVGDVVVTVGGSAQVNVTLTPATTVVVSDDAVSLIRVSEANAGQVIDERAIRDLPIDGRRFQDFARLTPTVQANAQTRGQLSFVGQRGVNSNVTLDGADFNEPFTGGIRGGERSRYIFTVPQSAVQEFQAVTAGYTAEYGRSTGGVLNAITRAGGNRLNGEAFYQQRSPSLGSDNPYGQQTLERQHQFGGGIGGPIRRDRAFFFLAGENQLGSIPRTVHFSALDALSGNVTPDIAPAYNFFRSIEQPFRQTNDGLAVLGRVDLRLTEKLDMALRYNTSDTSGQNSAALGDQFAPVTNIAIPANGEVREKTNTAALQLTWLAKASLTNELRAQYSRETHMVSSNGASPTVIANAVGVFGARNFLPNDNNDYRAQFSDSTSWLRGTHAVRFGIDYSHLYAYQNYGFNQFGAFTIQTADPIAALQILSGSGAGVNRFDNTAVIYSRLSGNRVVDGSGEQLGLFAQDNWRVRRDLTVSYGLRWDAQWNPQPAANNDFLVSNIRDFAFPLGKVDPTAIRNQMKQFGPRLGVAWNVGGRGKTVVRAHYGMFYGQTPLSLYMDPLNNLRVPRGNISYNVTPNAAGTVYAQFLAGGIDLNKVPLGNLPVLSPADVHAIVGTTRNPYAGAWTITTANNFSNPMSLQTTFGIEHEIGGGLVVDYEFYHVKTGHLERNIDYNTPMPAVRAGDASLLPFFGLRSGTSRPNPNIGFVLVRESGGLSMYNGNSVRVRYQRKRWQFAGNYTLSFNRSSEDNEADPWGTSYFNPYDRSSEYNWSSLDSRHQVSGYAVYQLPWGVEVSATGEYRSGLPLDASTGADISQILGNVNSLLPFANYGNRPLQAPGVPFLRNSFRNREYRTVDFRVLKSFRLREKMRAQLSGEAFNLFNFQNVVFQGAGLIYGSGILTNGQTAPVDPRFMRLRAAGGGYDPSTTMQLGTPLQAQLGLRLLF